MKEWNINLIIILRPLTSLKDQLSFHATKFFSLLQKIHKFEKLDWAYQGVGEFYNSGSFLILQAFLFLFCIEELILQSIGILLV